MSDSRSDGGVPTVRLGRHGPLVSALGLGCAAMSPIYRRPDAQDVAATFELAFELGIVLLDTAHSYADGHNETLVGSAIKGRRSKVILSTKFGLGRNDRGEVQVDARPETARRSCDESLRRLGTDYIDLYYLHRVDPSVPIEESVGAMAELVTAGKVRHLGLSEVTASQLHRAARQHSITAIQNEWSLWARQIEDQVLPAARELGIGIVPWAPLGRGFLAGAISSEADLLAGDARVTDPRLAGANLTKNLLLFRELRDVARRLEVTPAQVSLAWLKTHGPDVVPIPGTDRPQFLRENVEAMSLDLDDAALASLNRAFEPGSTAGNPDDAVARHPKSSTGPSTES